MLFRVDSLSGSEISLERQGAQIQQLYGTGSLSVLKLQGWRFSPCKIQLRDRCISSKPC
jgi:hypothetical protein